MKKFFSNKKVLFALRLILGFFFIAASLDKIFFPEIFKSIVAEYRLVPEVFLPLVSIVLPWLELVCGILLMLDIYTQSVALILAGVLCAYTAGITQNLVVGLIHECGCFNLLGLSEDISITTVLRDLIFIAMTLPILFFSNNVFLREKPGKKPAGNK